MALTKAVIVKLDSPGAQPIPVMFNPPRYELAKSNHYAEIKVPGLPASVLQFVGGDLGNLTTELFFDTSDSGTDVRSRCGQIADLTKPEAATHAPPRLLLLWGSLAFPCVLVSVRQAFDLFSAAGLPLRATLSVDFKGYDPAATFNPLSPMDVMAQVTGYVVKAGDTLAGIAASVYGDARQWRRIAASNGIDDPRQLGTGRRLQLPGSQ